MKGRGLRLAAVPLVALRGAHSATAEERSQKIGNANHGNVKRRSTAPEAGSALSIPYLQRVTKSRRGAGATKSGVRLALIWAPAGWGTLCEKCGLILRFKSITNSDNFVKVAVCRDLSKHEVRDIRA